MESEDYIDTAGRWAFFQQLLILGFPPKHPPTKSAVRFVQINNSVGIWIANIWIAEHLNKELLLVHYSNGLVFKWWSEYWSVNQMVIWIQNYHGTGHLNSKPFEDQTNPHDLNTKLVCYSDPYFAKWIQIPESFEYLKFWWSVFKWSGFWMVGLHACLHYQNGPFEYYRTFENRTFLTCFQMVKNVGDINVAVPKTATVTIWIPNTWIPDLVEYRTF